MIRAAILLTLAALPVSPTTSSAPPGMVAIAAGSFVRGQKKSDRPDETPPHRVQLRAFYLDETLVTRADFSRFIAASHHRTTAEKQGYGVGASEGMNDWEWERIPGASWKKPFWETTADTPAFLRDDAPVVMVSYFDAEAYCRFHDKRLPSEAEWEYAMRAGTSGRRYPWGDSPERSSGVYGLNFWQGASHRKNTRRDGHVYVSPVRAYPPNAWGLHDAVGNVWQWTADYYAPDTYQHDAASLPVAIDPRGPQRGDKRVLRGGSWWCGACTCEGNGLFYRGKSTPDSAYNNIGFRCAKDAAP